MIFNFLATSDATDFGSLMAAIAILNADAFGEAFIRFYGIPTVGKIKFKYHERKNLSNKISKIKLDKNEKIIDVSDKSEKEVANIVNYLRSKYAHAIIIEKGNEIA